MPVITYFKKHILIDCVRNIKSSDLVSKFSSSHPEGQHTCAQWSNLQLREVTLCMEEEKETLPSQTGCESAAGPRQMSCCNKYTCAHHATKVCAV